MQVNMIFESISELKKSLIILLGFVKFAANISPYKSMKDLCLSLQNNSFTVLIEPFFKQVEFKSDKGTKDPLWCIYFSVIYYLHHVCLMRIHILLQSAAGCVTRNLCVRNI